MSAHTPGPWLLVKAVGTDDMDCGWHVEPEVKDYQYRGMVCSLNDAEHIEGITKPERDANARLIAAAPALMEALIDANEALSDLPLMDPLVVKMRAAIAAAKGDE